MRLTRKPLYAAASLGFACFLALNSFSLWGFSYLPAFVIGEHADQVWSLPLALSNIVAFLAFACISARHPIGAPPSMGAIGGVSLGLICLLGFLGNGSALLLFMSGTSMGIGTTCCFLCWETIFSRMARNTRRACILAGSILSAASFALFATADPSSMLFVVAVLAFGNLGVLYVCLANMPRSNRETPVLFDVSRMRTYAGMLLCILAIGIISPVIDGAMPEQGSLIERGIIVHGANVLSAIALWIVWFALGKNPTVKSAYYLVFPLFVTALFLFPFVPDETKQAASFAASFGFTLFSIVMMVSCIDIAEKDDIHLAGLYSVFAFTTYTSRFVGGGISLALEHSPIPHDTLPMAAAFFLVYLLSLVMFLVSKRSRLDGETEPQDHKDPRQAAALEDRAERQCSLLAKRFGLTERQHEIMLLFAHGYDIPSIAKKLFISENTVRTHAKKLYLVLDVHSRQELIAIIEETETGADSSEPPAKTRHRASSRRPDR